MPMRRMLILMVAVIGMFGSDAFAIYAPSTGRFMQRDPIGYAGGSMNMYEYVLSNPMKYTDSMGLAPDWFNQWVIDQFDNSWDVKDFVYHYYGPGGFRYSPGPFNPADFRFGTGETVDLGKVGRGNWYKNKAAVKKRIKACRDKAKDLKDKMDAGGGCELDHSRIDGIDDTITGDEFEDLGVGFVIGTHGFSCNVKCTKTAGKTKCTIDYSMRDRFKDPADIPNWFNGPGTDIEPGGTPFDITYDWTEDYP